MERTGRAPLPSSLFLGLGFVGAVLPLAAFLPWLLEHGLDLLLLIHELFATRISAFFAWGDVISGMVVLVAAYG